MHRITSRLELASVIHYQHLIDGAEDLRSRLTEVGVSRGSLYARRYTLPTQTIKSDHGRFCSSIFLHTLFVFLSPLDGL